MYVYFCVCFTFTVIWSMMYIICVMTADQIPLNMLSSGNANFNREKERSICNCNLSSWSDSFLSTLSW